MKQQEYTRKAHIIRDMDGTVVFEGNTKVAATFNKITGKEQIAAHTIPSISKAKAKSRELQTYGNGRGQLKVVS